MKKLFVFAVFAFIGYAFIVNQNFRNSTIEEVKNVKEKINALRNTGSGNSSKEKTSFDYEQATNGHSDEAKQYFKEICYGSEYNKDGQIHKWNEDVKIYVAGEKRDYLISELNTIVYELNEIIDPIEIEFVNNKEEANYVIYFCSGAEYSNIEPHISGLIDRNWGIFTTNSRGSRIISGTMYVDIYRCGSISGQKHLLREELTQSFGLMNDSYKYENSIFYQGWTETTSYSQIDVELIEMLYN